MISIADISSLVAACFTGALAAFAALQLRDSKRSNERQNRAYVMIDSVDMRQIQGRWTAIVKVRNFGATPAYGVKIEIEDEWRLRTDCLVKLPFTSRHSIHPGNIIAPGLPLSIPVDINGLHAHPENWAILASGDQRPFIWGHITYRDAFDHERWTSFQVFSDLDGVLQMGHCAVGNDADH